MHDVTCSLLTFWRYQWQRIVLIMMIRGMELLMMASHPCLSGQITTDKGLSFPFTVCGIFVHLKSVLTSQSLKLTFLHLSFKFVIIYPSIYTVSCFIHKPTYWTWIHVFLHSFLYGSYLNPVSKMQWSQVSDSKHIRLEKQALQQPPSRHMRSDSKSKKKYVTE